MLTTALRTCMLIVAALTLSSHLSAQQQRAVTVKVQSGEKSFVGQPVGWDGKQIALLLLDGQLKFVPAKRENVEVLSDTLPPYSLPSLQNYFQKKYGKRYRVSTTENFVVVHPWGKPDFWAEPFEDFHRRFEYFFQIHDVTLSEPKFPLTVIVLRSRSDFDRHFHNDQKMHDPRIEGYYSRLTNQIVTYDPEARVRYKEDSWLYESATIIHEAAHQSAFNVGLHNRLSPPPKWLSEGLACLFEARGVHHAIKFTKQVDRVNFKHLKALQKYYAGGQGPGGLAQIILEDEHFDSKPEYAYALAWGLTFYLVENNPKAYFAYLQKDAARKNFKPYPRDQRLKDFATAFGTDIDQLETKMRDWLLGDLEK